MKTTLSILFVLFIPFVSLTASEAGDKARHDKAAKMLAIIDSYRATITETPPLRTLKIVYAVPKDFAPQPRYQERIDDWFTDFADFTRAEFKRNGFGEHELSLERNEKGGVKIHVVPGLNPVDSYNYGAAALTNADIKAACPQFVADTNEVVMVICGYSQIMPDSTVRIFSPYYGWGWTTHIKGRCFLMDNQYLDINTVADTKTIIRVQERDPHNMSLAQFNLTYLGGAFHELGHALSLPHNVQMDDEAKIGYPLMGQGNYHYRAERRGDKKRTYLSFTETARWIAHPLFSGSAKGALDKLTFKLNDYKPVLDTQTMTISGRIESNIPPYAIVVYADPGEKLGAVNADYDTLNWVVVPEADGSFTATFPVTACTKELWQLRVVVCFANGAYDTVIRQNFDKTTPLKTPYGRP